MSFSLPPTPPQAEPKPDPRPRQVRWAKRIAIVFGTLIVGFLALVLLVGLFAKPAPAPIVVAAPTVSAPPLAPVPTLPPPNVPVGPASSFTAGIYDVGNGSGQMAPGRYRTTGEQGTRGYCYYARLRDTTAGLDSIIANVNTIGPATVTVKPTDAAFEIQGNCVFERVS